VFPFSVSREMGPSKSLIFGKGSVVFKTCNRSKSGSVSIVGVEPKMNKT
jgi:hypothetical protein